MKDSVKEAREQARAQAKEREEATRMAADAILAGYTPIPPGDEWDDYTRLALDQLFLQIWQRPALSQREKRLVILGAIGALAASHKYAIHIGAAIRNGELSAEEAREIPILLMHYIGQMRASDLRAPTEQAIAENGR